MKYAPNPQIKDPRWQKRRLEILSRDGFTCTQCCDSESELQVHHRYYASGRDYWDYPDFALVTLCKDCHQKVRGEIEDFEHLLCRLFPGCTIDFGSNLNDIADNAMASNDTPKDYLFASIVLAYRFDSSPSVTFKAIKAMIRAIGDDSPASVFNYAIVIGRDEYDAALGVETEPMTPSQSSATFIFP